MSLFRNEEEEKAYTNNMVSCPFPVFFVLPSQEPYIRKRLAQRHRLEMINLIKTAGNQNEELQENNQSQNK